MIYFDHNATTPVDERVVEAMLPYLTTLYANPSSLYRVGRIARSAVDTAREQLATLLDAEPEQIIFTSGGTEANALALANAGAGRVMLSAIEHPSVYEQAKAMTNPVQVLGVNRQGLLPADTFETLQLLPGDFLALMLANNETGAIQDVSAIVARVKSSAVTVHCDAVQALGKIPLSFKQLGVDFMAVSSHKLYGPKGCGALIVANDRALQPSLRGGDQEWGRRAGTENVAAIVGFGKAAELAKNEIEQRFTRLSTLRQRLEQQLLNIPGLCIFAQEAPRLPNTVQFGIAGCRGDMLVMQLDRNNIAVSSGSACSAASQDPSPVLTAMGVEADLAASAIRVSLGKDNQELEIDQFVHILKQQLH
jgi:cysteine desulfurase